MLNVKSEPRYAIFEGEKQITDFIWKYHDFVDETLIVGNEQETWLYDTKSQKIISKIMGELYTYNEEMECAIIELDGKFGAYNFEGKEILPTAYQTVECEYGVLKVQNDEDMYGMYSIYGKELIPIKYDDIAINLSFDGRYNLNAANVRVGEVWGWHIVPINRFVEADKINITRTGLIEICKNGNWELLK